MGECSVLRTRSALWRDARRGSQDAHLRSSRHLRDIVFGKSSSGHHPRDSLRTSSSRHRRDIIFWTSSSGHLRDIFETSSLRLHLRHFIFDTSSAIHRQHFKGHPSQVESSTLQGSRVVIPQHLNSRTSWVLNKSPNMTLYSTLHNSSDTIPERFNDRP